MKKPIEKMNAGELADEFNPANAKSSVRYDYATMYRLTSRLRELHELTRWIPVSERLPTREDADAEGYVWVSAIQITMGDRANDSWLWSEVSLDGGIAYKPTHWKRITPPEGKP